MSQIQQLESSSARSKCKGVCSVCNAVSQLHISDGTVHLHGLRGSRCLGSNRLSVSTVDDISPAAQTQPSLLSSSACDSQPHRQPPTVDASLPPSQTFLSTSTCDQLHRPPPCCQRQSVCHHQTFSLRLLLLPKISAIPNWVHRS